MNGLLIILPRAVTALRYSDIAFTKSPLRSGLRLICFDQGILTGSRKQRH